MELTYFSKSISKPGLSWLGLTSVGISAMLICVPMAATLFCNWVSATASSEGTLRKFSCGSGELPHIFNASLALLSAIGLFIACAGIFVSRQQCLASISAAIFNLAVILLIVTRIF